MGLGRDDHVLSGVVRQVVARPITLTSRMQLRQMSITEAPGALVQIWPGEWGAGRLPGSVQSRIGFELDLRRFFFTKIDRRNWVSSFLELLSPNLQ